jgi:putative redox protein
MAVVTVRSAAGLRQEIEARGHRLTADEPLDAGGEDSGPTPYELLLAALGACTAITLRLYAQRKGWPLDGVEVRLEHRRRHRADCEECEGREVLLDQIDKRIELRGPLTDEQRARLLEIAERCPVQRTLTRPIQIVPAR